MMSDPASLPACPGCGAEWGPGVLACPRCHRLIHAERLAALAAEAEAAEREGRGSDALGAWRETLDLLPPSSRQHAAIATRIKGIRPGGPQTRRERAALSNLEAHRLPERSLSHGGARPAEAAPPSNPSNANSSHTAASGGKVGGRLAMLGTLGLLLWNFKALLVILVTKGKLLLLGLTKASTFTSMLVSAGLYWSIWGWKFALGLVVAIYIHEMGHVSALRRFGFKATAPMFIPGVGALVRLQQHPTNPIEDSRIGLAGPIWGLGATVAAYACFLIFQAASFGAIAKFSAWINLFNLLPLSPLDGGRGFRSLTRLQRILAAVVIATMAFGTQEGLLILLLVMAIVQIAAAGAPGEADWVGWGQYALLIVTLSLLAEVPDAWLGIKP